MFGVVGFPYFVNYIFVTVLPWQLLSFKPQDNKLQVVTSGLFAVFFVGLRDIIGPSYVFVLALKETGNRFSSVGSAVTPTNRTPAAED